MTAIPGPDHVPSPAELRLAMNLSPRAFTALSEIRRLTGDSKTEAVNKAIQTYLILQRAQAAGGGACIRDAENAEPVQYRFH